MMNIQNFYKICGCIKAEWRSPKQIDEKNLIEALSFVKENKKYKPELLKYFIGILNGEVDMPLELVEFCMRELQWPEIKTLALEQLKKSDPRIRSSMEHVLEVYEPEWSDSDLYQYYSK